MWIRASESSGCSRRSSPTPGSSTSGAQTRRAAFSPTFCMSSTIRRRAAWPVIVRRSRGRHPCIRLRRLPPDCRRSVQERVPQYDGLVVRLIVRRVDERQRTFLREGPQLAQQLVLLRELRPVAAAELLPTLRVVREPFAQLVTGSDFLHPLGEGGVGFLQSTRPQAIDENARSIARRGCLVGALDPDLGRAFGADHLGLPGAIRAVPAPWRALPPGSRGP